MTVIKTAAHARRVFRDYFGHRWPAVCSRYGYAMDHRRSPRRSKSFSRNEFSIILPRDPTVSIQGSNELTPPREYVWFRFRRVIGSFGLEYSPICDKYGEIMGDRKSSVTESDVIKLLNTTRIPDYDWQLYLGHYGSRLKQWWFNISVVRTNPINKIRRWVYDLKYTRLADVFYYTSVEQVKRAIERHYGREWLFIQLAGHTGGWQIQPDDYQTKWYASITPLGGKTPWVIKVYEDKELSRGARMRRVEVRAYRDELRRGTAYDLGSREGYATPRTLPRYLKNLDRWRLRDT